MQSSYMLASDTLHNEDFQWYQLTSKSDVISWCVCVISFNNLAWLSPLLQTNGLQNWLISCNKVQWSCNSKKFARITRPIGRPLENSSSHMLEGA